MHEAQEVSDGLLVSGGHPPILFDQAPKTLGQVPVLVPIGVVRSRLLPITLGRDHRFRSHDPDRLDQLVTVITLVAYDDLGLCARDQSLRLGHVGLRC